MNNSFRKLPSPVEMSMPLVQVLGRRRSGRDYSPQPLDESLLAALLWASAGQNSPDGRRTVPSAMDSREVLAYVFDENGIWLYDAAENALHATVAGDKRMATTAGQEFVGISPVTIVYVGDRTRMKVEMTDVELLTTMALDAGMMAQAGQMAATAMGLTSVMRTAFDPETVRIAAALSEEHLPLIALTVGFPS